MSLLVQLHKSKLKKNLDAVRTTLPETVYNFYISYYINYKLKDSDGIKYIKDAYKSLKCLSEHITWFEKKEITINKDTQFNFDGEIKTIPEEALSPNVRYVTSQSAIERYALLSDEALANAASPIILIKN